MSEPRKLYTGSASGGFDQSQYEAARRRAQEQANQNARRRIIQQPMRTQQQARQIRQQAPVQEPVQEAPQPVQQASVQETPRELTHAQRQAMAYRAAAERKYGNTVQFPTREIQTRRPSRPAQPSQQRTIHRDGAAQTGRPRAQVQQLDVNKVQGSRPAFNYDEAAPAAGGIQMEETPRTHKAHHKDEAAPRTHRANGGGRKPPRDGYPADPKPHGKKSGKFFYEHRNFFRRKGNKNQKHRHTEIHKNRQYIRNIGKKNHKRVCPARKRACRKPYSFRL